MKLTRGNVARDIKLSYEREVTLALDSCEQDLIRFSSDFHEICIAYAFRSMCIVSQLDKCLKFMAFQGVILHRVQSFLSPRTGLNFRHLSTCGTKVRTGACWYLVFPEDQNCIHAQSFFGA